jgi:hypothetical protein
MNPYLKMPKTIHARDYVSQWHVVTMKPNLIQVVAVTVLTSLFLVISLGH